MSGKLFELVCLDSNQLLANGWPFLSKEIIYFIKLASDLSIEICLPQPVLHELRNSFLDKLETDIRSVWPNAANIMNKLSAMGVEPQGVMPQRTERQQIREYYDIYVRSICQQHNFQCPAYPSIGLESFFEKASKKEPPFESQGKGFQDAVIYYSFLEELKRERKKGAFISADGAFGKSKDALERAANESGVEVALYRNLDEVIAELAANSDRQAKLWQQQRDELEDLIKKRWDEVVSEFISNVLRNSQLGLRNIHFEQIGKSRMSEIRKPWIPPLTDRRADAPVPMKFAVRVIIPVVVNTPTSNRLFWPSFDDPNKLSVSNSLADGVLVDLSIEVHGEAILDNDRVCDFRLESVNRFKGGYQAFLAWGG